MAGGGSGAIGRTQGRSMSTTLPASSQDASTSGASASTSGGGGGGWTTVSNSNATGGAVATSGWTTVSTGLKAEETVPLASTTAPVSAQEAAAKSLPAAPTAQGKLSTLRTGST